MTQLTFDDLATAKLPQLISRKESFEVVGLSGKLLEAVRLVENKIEVTGLTCRVYTAGRIGLAAGSFAGVLRVPWDCSRPPALPCTTC